MNLSEREYWKPSEAAAVLGRSAAYWVRMFDTGVVRGYKDRGRHLQADSCRAHLARLVDAQVVQEPDAQRVIEAEQRFWNKQRAGAA